MSRKTQRVRMHKDERRRLKKLKERELVRELAVEADLIEDKYDRFTYADLLSLVIPDDAEQLARPEDEMVEVEVQGMKHTIRSLAGENVSEARVIREFVKEFEEDLKEPAEA